MNPSQIEAVQITDVVITLLIPVLIARLVAAYTYPNRYHVFWTAAFPTGALLLFMTRISINRRVENIFPIESWGAAVTWGLLLASQLIATIYTWWPSYQSLEVDSAISRSPDYNHQDEP